MRVVLLAVILLLSSGGYTTATCYFFNRLRLVTGFYMYPEHTPVGAFTQIGAKWVHPCFSERLSGN